MGDDENEWTANEQRKLDNCTISLELKQICNENLLPSIFCRPKKRLTKQLMMIYTIEMFTHYILMFVRYI